jgi:beta-phosphoglucomutase-like phosphatase (HAD superfamily)
MLQRAITKLCSVKVVHVGLVSAKLDAVFATNSQRADARRETKRVEEEEQAKRKIANKAIKFNTALEEPLAPTVGALLAHMKAMDNAVGVCKDYLKRQFNGRLLRAEKDEFTYPSIGPKYRTKNKQQKLKMTPSDKQNDRDYLQELVLLMMKADSRRGALDTEAVALEGLLRTVPTLNVETTSAHALKRRKQLETEVCLEATQVDDPWLSFLTREYVGKICFLHDIAERHKLYRVCNIAYWTSTKTRYANWEATLEPIHMATSGEYYVADDDVVVGPKGIRITKSKVLLGYIVAQYIDGDDEEPTRTECVDLYVENALEKLKAYVFKLQRSKSYAPAT